MLWADVSGAKQSSSLGHGHATTCSEYCLPIYIVAGPWGMGLLCLHGPRPKEDTVNSIAGHAHVPQRAPRAYRLLCSSRCGWMSVVSYELEPAL